MGAPWDKWYSGKNARYSYIDDLTNPMGEFRAAPSCEMFTGRTNGKTYLVSKLSEEDIKKSMDCSSFITQTIRTVTRAINEAPFVPKSIEVSADHRTVVVVWNDKTKTIVKRSENDPDDLYMAFTAALAKRIFSTNSRIKKVIREKVNYHQPKEKKQEEQEEVKELCENCKYYTKSLNEPPCNECGVNTISHFIPAKKGENHEQEETSE